MVGVFPGFRQVKYDDGYTKHARVPVGNLDALEQEEQQQEEDSAAPSSPTSSSGPGSLVPAATVAPPAAVAPAARSIPMRLEALERVTTGTVLSEPFMQRICKLEQILLVDAAAAAGAPLPTRLGALEQLTGL